MKPQTIGRTLGIGLRVAGRIAGRHLAGEPHPASATQQAAHSPANPHVDPHIDARAASRKAGHAAGKASRGVARGVGGFLHPFRRVGGILWLEVTGVFFMLPVIVFTPTVWHTRASWEHGPDHRTFVVSIVMVVLFFYLGVTSFWRARRK